ncbi:hypothetical protein [Asticcacaulis sp.]|uniref:hypothetical protein n=1 Tax=Asticcacaulis sp. TaxID=1872648 RepID=UPI0031CE1868
MSAEDSLFEYLLKSVTGQKFEALAKRIYGEVDGFEFHPLGGIHDGGADAFYLPHVFSANKPRVFYQISTTDENRSDSKIVSTIEALRKNGRDVGQLYYITTEKLPKRDIIQQKIFEEYGVLLSVKDGEHLHGLINNNSKIHKIFYEQFGFEISEINKSKPFSRPDASSFIVDPTVFAQIEYELDNQDDGYHLDEGVVDALIYWSLRNTNSDEKIFLNREEIKSAISSVVLTDSKFLHSKIDERISHLIKKGVGEEFRIRVVNPGEKFCISFQMRKRIAEKSLNDDLLRDEFISSIRERISLITDYASDSEKNKFLSDIVISSIHEFFIEQGLLLSAFLERKIDEITADEQIVERQVKKAISVKGKSLKISPEDVGKIMLVLRNVFYNKNSVEQSYLLRISRTSLLMNTLKSSPRMLEYFNQMSGRFRLLVGADMLVKAISEHFLKPEDRIVDKLLKACVEMGCELTLTECVLEEVYTHLHAVDLEYRNHYMDQEKYMKDTTSLESNKILLRAYFYNRSKYDGGWDGFINSMVSPKNLRAVNETGRRELHGLLTQRYQMKFISRKDMISLVSIEEVDDLASSLDESRNDKNAELSKNDALMSHVVYGLRAQRNESAIYEGFGLSTWWLTKETLIVRHTRDLVSKHGGNHYIIRPEFILNFIVLAPKASKVRATFGEMLPTNVGLQLGEHLKPERMKFLLRKAGEWAKHSPERVSVLIENGVNRLKHARYKRYLANIHGEPLS